MTAIHTIKKISGGGALSRHFGALILAFILSLFVLPSFAIASLVPGFTVDFEESSFIEIISNRNAASSFAFDQEGRLLAWGLNVNGQLGLGDNTDRYVPTLVPIAGLSGVTSFDTVIAGGNHTLALDQQGRLWAWGLNTNGQLGLGDTTARNVPTLVPLPTGVTSFDTAIAGVSHTLALDQQGRLWAWGLNTNGQLGLGDAVNRSIPSLVLLAGLTHGGIPVTSFDAVIGGGNFTFALDQQGRLWAWGFNSVGQLGLGDTTARDRPTFVPIAGLSGVTSFDTVIAGVNHTLAFDQQGRLWTWGNNGQGRLGLGDTADRGRPTLVPLADLSGVTSFDTVIAGNSHTLALDQQGRLWAWGNNGNGRLGIGNTTEQHRPTLVPLTGLSGVSSFDVVAAGSSHTLALDQQGRLWAWGNNGSGRLGIGNTTEQHRPVRQDPALPTLATPAPAELNVSIDLEYVTLTFDSPMNTAQGTLSIDRDATIDMNSAVWSNGATTLTVPVTLVPGSYLTVHTITATDFAQAESETPTPTFSWFFRTEVEPLDTREGTLYKTLQAPPHMTLPDADFAFSFTPVVITLSDDPLRQSQSDGPTIPNQVISFLSSNAVTSVSSVSVSGSIDLMALFNAQTFPVAGIFVYELAEISPFSGNPDIIYDTARYQLRVQINNDGEVVSLDILEMTYNTDTSQWTPVFPKVDAAVFVNLYFSDAQVDLEVTKTIEERDLADLDTLFDFELVLTPPAMMSLPTTMTAYIHDSTGPIDDLARSPVTIGANNIFSFQLRDGERIVIQGLPLGTVFSVTEALALDFAPSVRVYSGGEHIHSDAADPETALSTGEHLVEEGGRNAADFINVHRVVPLTGLVVENGLAFLVVAALVGLMMLAAQRKRKSIETLPLA